MATPHTPEERPLRADARRNRARILDAARSACAQHGANVQIDDVARSAGVGVGTVYRHFPTKDALIEALVGEKYRIIGEHAREALEADDPWDGFAEFLRRNAAVMAADAGLRDVLARLGPGATGSPESREEFEALARRVLDRAQAAGRLRADVSLDDVAMLMSGLGPSMSHGGLDWRRHLEILLDGLRARP